MKIKLNHLVPMVGMFLGGLLATNAQQLGSSSSGTIIRSVPGTPLPNATNVPTAAGQAGSTTGTSAGPSLGQIQRQNAPNGILPGSGATGPGVTTALPTPSATPARTSRSRSERDQNNAIRVVERVERTCERGCDRPRTLGPAGETT